MFTIFAIIVTGVFCCEPRTAISLEQNGFNGFVSSKNLMQTASSDVITISCKPDDPNCGRLVPETPLKDPIEEDKQRKRCTSCLQSYRCAKLKNCKFCEKYCREGDPVGALADPDNDEDIDDFEVYFTLGEFGPGFQMNQIEYLLDLPEKGKYDKLVILGRNKNEQNAKNCKTLFVDTIESFKENDKEKCSVLKQIKNTENGLTGQKISGVNNNNDEKRITNFPTMNNDNIIMEPSELFEDIDSVKKENDSKIGQINLKETPIWKKRLGLKPRKQLIKSSSNEQENHKKIEFNDLKKDSDESSSSSEEKTVTDDKFETNNLTEFKNQENENITKTMEIIEDKPSKIMESTSKEPDFKDTENSITNVENTSILPEINLRNLRKNKVKIGPVEKSDQILGQNKVKIGSVEKSDQILGQNKVKIGSVEKSDQILGQNQTEEAPTSLLRKKLNRDQKKKTFWTSDNQQDEEEPLSSSGSSRVEVIEPTLRLEEVQPPSTPETDSLILNVEEQTTPDVSDAKSSGENQKFPNEVQNKSKLFKSVNEIIQTVQQVNDKLNKYEEGESFLKDEQRELEELQKTINTPPKVNILKKNWRLKQKPRLSDLMEKLNQNVQDTTLSQNNVKANKDLPPILRQEVVMEQTTASSLDSMLKTQKLDSLVQELQKFPPLVYDRAVKISNALSKLPATASSTPAVPTLIEEEEQNNFLKQSQNNFNNRRDKVKPSLGRYMENILTPKPHHLNEKIGSSLPESRSTFKNFGKIVPGLGTVKTEDGSLEKVFFLGKDINIPLNAKKTQDGTYKLTLDVEKLCDCKEATCNKKHTAEVEEERRLTRSALESTTISDGTDNIAPDKFSAITGFLEQLRKFSDGANAEMQKGAKYGDSINKTVKST